MRIAQLALAAFAGAAVVAAISAAKPILLPPPGSKMVNGRRLLTANLPSGQPIGTATTVDWDSHCIRRDGSASWVLKYGDATGAEVFRKNLTTDAACSSIIDQRYGTAISTPCPAGVASNIASEVTATTTMLTNCISANKCNP